MDDGVFKHLPTIQTPNRCHVRSGARRGVRQRVATRRAVMLLIVLLTLALAVAVITPLATLSGVEAVTTVHGATRLRHRLAAESVVAMLPELLQHDQRLNRDLDRFNRGNFAFVVGEVPVSVLLQDDTAKLPLPLLFESRHPRRVREALDSLQSSVALPPLEVMPVARGPSNEGQPRLRRTGCLDDLFTAPTDAALFGMPDTSHAWAQYVTPLGHAVHVYRADPAVLEAVLADLQVGLGQRLAQAREIQADQDVDELLAGLEVPEPVARGARQRLTRRTECYSLLIRTQIERDERQQYVICSAAPPPQVLVNWEVAP